MDVSKKTIELADQIFPAGTPTKVVLAFIEKVSFALEAAFEAGKKEGVKAGKKEEKERSSRHGSVSHSSWCSSEDCLGQCMVR